MNQDLRTIIIEAEAGDSKKVAAIAEEVKTGRSLGVIEKSFATKVLSKLTFILQQKLKEENKR